MLRQRYRRAAISSTPLLRASFGNDMENPAALKLRIRILQEGAVVMGPGRADLLALIRNTGSIAAAGRKMGMSYKRAWVLVEAMNKSFAAPLVEAAKGGSGGGGAKLTVLGIAVLSAYQALEQDCLSAAEAPLARLQRALATQPAPPVSPGDKSA
jgi:molybdate transport system regulatory protein